MEYILYFSPSPAPQNLAQEHLDRLIPMRFSSEKDALHGAVLVMRGGQHPWLIAGPEGCVAVDALIVPRSPR